jgi:quercetin dioxygenase-like cupin family protein
MIRVDLLHRSSELPQAWKSAVVGRVADANLKVLRMDGAVYPDETHDFDEGLLVLEGQMNLQMGGELVVVRSGEVCIVPAGVPHAVASGSHGTLVIIDR